MTDLDPGRAEIREEWAEKDTGPGERAPVRVGRTAKWTGPVLRGGAPSANGHIYPRGVVERALAAARPRVEARTMLGYEYGVGLSEKRKLTDMSLVVTDLRLEGDLLVAEVETLATPAGRALCEVLAGLGPASVEFRTAGDGHIDAAGVVGDDYVFETIITAPVPAKPTAT